MTGRTYLDWNATAPLRAGARAAMLGALETTGNPSSVHGEGRAARRLVEHARAQVAALVGAEPGNVIFTSGATEANMLALTPALQIGADVEPRDRLFVSAIEHPSVLAGGCFARRAIRTVPVTSEGKIDCEGLRVALGRAAEEGAKRPLVSIIAANNETGVVQPIRSIAAIVHEMGGLLHVDAVQAIGRIPFEINSVYADLVSISAHKIGGPQGIGALIRRDKALHFREPLMRGGGQERGLRAGTENVVAIAGFGAAAAETRSSLAVEPSHLAALRDRLEGGLRVLRAETVIFGAAAERVSNTTLLAVPGMKAETTLIALDLDGIAVSSGAACSSGKVAPSHVLAAMGVAPELARGAIRVSLGYASTEADIERFLQAWRKRLEPLAKAQGIAA